MPDARARAALTDVFGRDADVLEIDGVQFVARGAKTRFASTGDRFPLVKRPDLVDRIWRSWPTYTRPRSSSLACTTAGAARSWRWRPTPTS